jgi:hypothetical protein
VNNGRQKVTEYGMVECKTLVIPLKGFLPCVCGTGIGNGPDEGILAKNGIWPGDITACNEQGPAGD